MASDAEVENWKGGYRSDRALACPFCGEMPMLVPWHGGGPKKRMIMCRSNWCEVSPSVTGSTERRAVDYWNTRAPPARRKAR
jgi:hypothetical protein